MCSQSLNCQAIHISSLALAVQYDILKNNPLHVAIQNLSKNKSINKLSAPLLKTENKKYNRIPELAYRSFNAVLKRDNFKCRMCSASIKDNKTLGLEVHHAKSL